MKQVIPFKKDIIFKTKVSEILSISLEHTLKLVEDDTISGEFIISGEYKITDYSINKEEFSYTIPFDIALNSKYNIADSIVDIDDFYYEIINNDTLRVNVDVVVDGIEEIIIEEIVEPKKEEVIEESEVEIKEEDRNFEDEIFEEIFPKSKTITEPEIIKEGKNMKEEKIMVETSTLFKTNDTETFMTYKVYIVRENDTLDTIITKYNITKEELSLYNDINNINFGEKIIIPYISNV